MVLPPETTPSGRIVLASSSAARAALLRAAGVDFAIEPAAIDEVATKQEARRSGESAVACAIVLATEKACAVSRRDPAALVIGADQVLVSGVEWLDKPNDLGEARRQLLGLRGRTHVLATAMRGLNGFGLQTPKRCRVPMRWRYRAPCSAGRVPPTVSRVAQ